MHGRIRIAPRFHAEGDVLDDAEESVANVNSGMRQQLAAIDCGEDTEKYRNLDGARGVEPAVGLVVKLQSCLGVVKGDADRLR